MEIVIDATPLSVNVGHDQGGAWCAKWYAGPPFPLTARQACLGGSGVPRDRPLEGYSLWDFASISYMCDSAGSSLFDFSLFDLICLSS